MSLTSRTAAFDLGVTLPTRSSGVCAYELTATTSAPHYNTQTDDITVHNVN